MRRLGSFGLGLRLVLDPSTVLVVPILSVNSDCSRKNDVLITDLSIGMWKGDGLSVAWLSLDGLGLDRSIASRSVRRRQKHGKRLIALHQGCLRFFRHEA